MKTRFALLLALAFPLSAEERPPEPSNPTGTTVVSVRWYRYALYLEQQYAALQSERDAAAENERAQMLALLLKLEPVAEKAARAVSKPAPYSIVWTFAAAPAGVTSVVIERKNVDGGDWVKLAELPPTATGYTDPDRPLGRFTYRRSHKAADGTMSVVAHLPTAILHAPVE